MANAGDNLRYESTVGATSLTDHRGALTAEAYSSQISLQIERRAVFEKNWVCVGIIDDVPEIGDVKEVKCGGTSLILTRAKDRKIYGFLNYCRHRGMRLVQEGCSKHDRIVCPYHAWAYGLDGKLLRTPRIGGPSVHDADVAEVGLPEGLAQVALATWHRLIFVNVSGDAGSFEEYIKPLNERWKKFDLSVMKKAESATFDVHCNWKLAVENFIDVYHVPFVHPTLRTYSKVDDRYYINEPNLFGQGNPRMRAPDDSFGKLPVFPGVSETEIGFTEALCLFPNLLITLFSDHLRMIIVDPIGVDACRERVEVFVAGDDAMTEELSQHRVTLMERFTSFNKEDLGIVSELQKSMTESRFPGAVFSKFWDRGVESFQKRIAQGLSKP